MRWVYRLGDRILGVRYVCYYRVLDKVVWRDLWLMLGLDYDCEKVEQGANKGLGKRGLEGLYELACFFGVEGILGL